MADKEKYMIKIQGKLIEVTEDVYYAYFRMERQERWQEEKKQEHEVVSYDALDNGEMNGVEAIQDMATPSMDELAIAVCLAISAAILVASFFVQYPSLTNWRSSRTVPQ